MPWHLNDDSYRCWSTATRGPDDCSNEFRGSELVPPDGEVSSCWGDLKLNTLDP